MSAQFKPRVKNPQRNPMKNLRFLSNSLALGAIVLAAGTAESAQLTWLGNTDINLLNGANYVGSVPPVSGTDGVLFNAAGTQGANLILNTTSSFQFSNTGGALTFSNLASAYTITGQSGTTELILGSGAIVNDSSNAQTFNVAVRRNTGTNITIGANDGSIVFGNTFNLQNSAGVGTANLAFGTTTGGVIGFDGNVITAGGGTGAVNIVAAGTGGAGTVVFNGSSNTGLNSLTINAGNTVRLGSTTALGSLSTMTFSPNGATNSVRVINDASGAISTTASLAFTTGGNFVLGESGDTSANNISFTGSSAITADTNRTITINGTGATVSSASVWTNSNATSSRTLTIDGAGNMFQIGGIGIGATGETNNRNFTVAGTGNLRVTGGITNGSGTGTRALTVSTSGTVIIDGNSNYSGVTAVNAGSTLLVNGTHSGGNTYTVAGTLGGTGSIGSAVVVNSGGVLQASSVNDLAFGSSLNVSGALGSASPSMHFTLGAPGTTILDVTGLLTIGVGLLNFDDFSFATGGGFGAGVYNLFSYTTLSGSLGSSLVGTIGGLDATISNDTLNSSIIVTVVPEPSTIGLIGLALGGMLFLRRRFKA